MAATFSTAAKIITGCGSFDELATNAVRLGRHALVVLGRHAMQQTGTTVRALGALEAAGCRTGVYGPVPPEPTVAHVDAGREVFRQAGCDLVIGIGGGSVIDVAKGIGALARTDAPTATFFAGQPTPPLGVPIIAVPTTAGTGAEVTVNSVLVNPAGPAKQSIRGDALLPAVAIVDPELTVSARPEITARSGMDALTQAIEAYWSIHASPITDALAMQAIELISGHIIRAFRRGDDLAARESMAYGSLIAGMAFANARLGAVHGLAHPLGVRYGIAHGEVCAILLPHVMRLNRPFAPAKYQRVSQIVGGDAASFAARLLDELGLPTTLRHASLKRADFKTIVAEAMPSGSLKANPKKVTEDDLMAILTALA
jgi:alcohol dehydrogenase class IV